MKGRRGKRWRKKCASAFYPLFFKIMINISFAAVFVLLVFLFLMLITVFERGRWGGDLN